LAIVGMGCRLPGAANDVDSFWKLLVEGRSGIQEVPADRWDLGRYYEADASVPGMIISKWGGFIENLDRFDARFWGLSPREAMRMDPQQRWLLEVAWEALEDSGTAPRTLRGTEVGVFVGIASNDYAWLQMPYHEEIDAYTNSGNTASIASNRISYLLDLRGPSASVDTACSSSLVAVWMACRSIWSGNCTSALAGGVNALIMPHGSIGFSRASMLSPTGQCYSFDARANGYVRAEGAGMVYLKPLNQALADRDRIYAVVRAAVVNQDGHTSSMTVPGVEGQSAMLREAYREAGLPPGAVAYVEAHGTGTPVGDPIEVTAIGQVLNEGRRPENPCLIGSVKTNIGHLEAGSGIAGLIKAALVLHKETVPPCCNFESPNPNIPFATLGLEVADRLQPLPRSNGRPPLAGVNSFGFGGTNAHVVLEGAGPPVTHRDAIGERAQRPYVLPISARDDVALRSYVESYREILADPSQNLADVCGSAGNRKEQHDQRLFFLGDDAEQLRDSMSAWLRSRRESENAISARGVSTQAPLVFVFTGQGPQWWAMGRQLLEREPIFRQTVAAIDELFRPLAGFSLLEEMTRSEQDSRIDRTDVAQPAIFALQVGLAELWKSWGVQPAQVIGHSVGEVAAAYCAGIYTLQDAVRIIYHRSRLQNTTGGHGLMLAAGVTASEARAMIGRHADRVQIAVFNSPSLVTLAGDTEPLEEIAKQLEATGKFQRFLRINYAFHTHQMEPIRDELLEVLAEICPRPARVPFVSTVTGGFLEGEQLDNSYWWRNVRQPVLFGPAIANLLSQGQLTFLEIGPHPALASSLNEYASAEGQSGSVFHSLRRKADESRELLVNLAGLSARGLKVDWAAVNQSTGEFVTLPRYPWNRESYWLESKKSARDRMAPAEHPLLGLRTAAAKPTWQFVLHPGRYAYLDDHRFWDSVVFPGAGYGEIGIALARLLFPDEPHAVEDLEIKKALFITADQPPTIQVVFDPEDKSYFVHSNNGDSDHWDLNAQGRLMRVAPAEPRRVELSQLRECLTDYFDHERYYGEFAAAGYQFGPNFQHIQNVWRKRGEALAEIVVPEAILQTVDDYHFHPAVLDACFHIFKGVQVPPPNAVPEDYFYLPQGIRRIRMTCDKPPTRLWAHARLLKEDGASLVSDILVYDDNGLQIAEILGFRADHVEQKKSADDVDNCYYQFAWQRCPLPGRGIESPYPFASGSEILEAVRKQIPDVCQRHTLEQYRIDFVPRMEALASQLIQNAWIELGWDLEVGQQFTEESHVKRLKIVDAHRRLAGSQLRFLEERGWLRQRDNKTWEVLQVPRTVDVSDALAALAVDYPRFATEVDLHQRTGPHLAAILNGSTDPLQLLFPGGSLEVLKKFYYEGADLPAYHELIRAALIRATAAAPARRALRVLQVGAGTGSLTRHILPALPAEQTEFAFTDIGPAFLAAAKTQFADHANVKYELLDLEKDPLAQGFSQGGFDVILANDVLHATCDVRRTLQHLRTCLAPGGLLLFLELLPRRHSWNSIFGLLQGWWHYTDASLRQESPLLDRPVWHDLLADCGFENIGSFIAHENDDDGQQAVYLAFAPTTTSVPAEVPALAPESNAAPRGYLILADAGGVSDCLTSRLQAQGAQIVRARPGSEFCEVASREYIVPPDSPEDLRRLLTEAATAVGGLVGIVHGWSLDHPSADGLDAAQLSAAQQTGVLNALRLMQLEDVLPKHVWFVTRNVHSVDEQDRVNGLASSPLVGLLRVANNELAQCQLTMVDLDDSVAEDLATDLFYEITASDGESETAYRAGRRLALRLQRARAEDLPVRTRPAVKPDGTLLPYRLETAKPGILTNLVWNETRRRAPGPREIEIRVRAGGINFRDVMKALGTYPGNPIDVLWFGDDVAGVIERVGSEVRHLQPGDEVAGMAPYGFRAFVTVDARMVFRKPPHLSFEDAATIPTVFLTSYYALVHLARLQPGEKVLIHAGAGGVGQSAIQIAKRLGLEIFATAGSEDKRRLLEELGVHHVLNSRTLEFADQILEITNGQGVDAVLNSLAGDFIPKSMSVLAPFGRFLEIGKIDIYKNSKIGLEPLRNNISYFVIDLAQHLIYKPDFVAGLFAELGERFAKRDYEPLSYSVFPISKVVDAFRFMAQGKHVGKNVLSFDADDLRIGPSTEPETRYSPDATYLITGGAGGFGLELAKWMAEHGARNLVLSSRSGPREESLADIEQMRAAGVNVVDARCDVTRSADVTALIRRIQKDLPPLKGIIHGAMVLDDEFLANLDEPRFRKALDPKMLGAWNLHVATQDLDLDEFISFSSFSAVIGGPKQSNYNAGNYFLEALAQRRRALGLPAETIAWGALLGAGFVERNQKTAQYLEKVGMKAFRMDEALRVFARLTQHDAPQIVASRADWRAISKSSVVVARSKTYAALTQENREAEGGGSLVGRLLGASSDARQRLVEDFLVSQVASVFGAEESKIGRDVPLTSLGLDSLMAIELTNRIERALGMGIPMGSLLNGPSITKLSETVLVMLAPSLASGTGTAETESTGTAGVLLEKIPVPQDGSPLSQSQQALWKLARQGLAGPRVFRAQVSPRMQTEVLQRAWDLMLQRHPILSMVVRDSRPAPVQRHATNSEPDFRVLDLSTASLAQIEVALAEEAQRPFDLQRGPLVRLRVVETSGESQQLLLAISPILADRWSVALLLGEMLEAYAALAAGDSWSRSRPEFVFEDFVAWEQKQLESAAGARSLEFWKRQLQDAPLYVQLATDEPRPQVASSEEGTKRFTLDEEGTHPLLALAAQQDASLFATLLASFEILMHLECEQADLLVGTTLPGRQHPELEHVVGCFANVVAIRSRTESDSTCAEMIRRAEEQVQAARAHQEMPLSRLVEHLYVRPEASRLPLVQVAFLMERDPGQDRYGLSAGLTGRGGHRFHCAGFAIETSDGPVSTLPYEIALVVEEAGGRLYGTWQYNPDLFAPETIDRLHAGWTAVLEQVARDPLQRVADVQIEQRKHFVRVLESNPVVNWRDESEWESGPATDYEREAQLDPTIVTSGSAPCDPEKFDRVLLTGASGFLGAFLLDDLLRQTQATVYCLVRASSPEQALERLRDNLDRYDLMPPGFSDRVVPVVGDLSEIRLGLSEERFQELAVELDAIYHNGAIVNLVYPYPMLRDSNVRGTQEILRLAALHHVKPTHYVSTFWVLAADGEFARDVVTEEDELPPCESLAFGYSRSKWVCEKMIQQARERGLPVSIYRPGYVTGDSRTGACKADDFLHTITLACARVGSIPALDLNMEVTPVDYVSRAIVQLSQQPEHLGNTYHLVNPQPLPIIKLAKWMQHWGRGVQVLPYSEWHSELSNLAQGAPEELLRPLMSLLGAGDGMEPGWHPRYDCRIATEHLAASGISCPAADDALLTTYHLYLERSGLLYASEPVPQGESSPRSNVTNESVN